MNTDDRIEVIETSDSARIALPVRPPMLQFSKGRRLEAIFAIVFGALSPVTLNLLMFGIASDEPAHASQLIHPQDGIGVALSITAICLLLGTEAFVLVIAFFTLQLFNPRWPDLLIDRRFIRQHALGPMDWFRIPLTAIRAVSVVPIESVRRPRHALPGTFLVRVIAGQRSRCVGGPLSHESATHLATTLAHQFQRLGPTPSPDTSPV